MVSVLVTGAGAPGIRGTIYALRQNPDHAAVALIGVDVLPDVVGRLLVDRFHQVPPPEDAGYVEALAAICRREAVDLVIPQTTRETAILAPVKDALLREGIRIMVSDAPAIEVANNKWRLLEACRTLGLPVAQCRLARSETDLVRYAHELGYPGQPVVVKPPVSNGMRGVRVLKECAWDARRFLTDKPSGLEISLADLTGILRRGDQWPELLVMEYLPGPEYSVDAFRGEHVAIAVPRIRRSIRSGISFDTEVEFHDDISQYTLTAASHVGLRYAFGFQFKLDGQGTPKCLEANPRVQGTMVASVFAGVNVIWLGVKELLGESVSDLPGPLRAARFYRYWGGVGVAGSTIDDI